MTVVSSGLLLKASKAGVSLGKVLSSHPQLWKKESAWTEVASSPRYGSGGQDYCGLV